VEVTCRSSPDHAKRAGEAMELSVDTSKMLIFDPDTGVRLARK